MEEIDISRAIVERKIGKKLNTPEGCVAGEKSMWTEKAEKEIVDNKKEIYPGFFVCGMVANPVSSSQRIGAISGGMFLSGEKDAQLIDEKLKGGGKQ
ncbi:MAG: hypothetical protein NC899_03675 [Candidatus Omnitrophica bacterium]|nr:hypothetical protein [Candidatus Omnitrophota bacterium]